MADVLYILTGGLFLWLVALCFVFLLTVIIHLFNGGAGGRPALSAIETLIALAAEQSLIHLYYYEDDAQESIPAVVLSLDLILTAAAVREILSCIREREERLSLLSVKECMDELPVGICFYWNGGLTKLVNLKMDSIALRLTGSGVSDAEHFRQTLFAGTETPVVCLEDGTAYSFAHFEDTLDGEPIHELLAFDVSEEYRLTARLREKQKEAGKINARLKALNDSIRYIVMDRETLQIKMHIHDSFGKMLLMTKQYLLSPEKTDKAEMLSLWRRNIALLKNGERETWQTPYYFSLSHAESLGIRIELHGELPAEETLISVVDSAITVHVTNVLRHTRGGYIAFIETEKTADGYTMRFTNNGAPPAEPVKETGGLANLRRRIEAIGGTMTVNSAPRFEMILHLPEHITEEY